MHHVVPWEHGGSTDLDNLVPLCSKCHHLVHDAGWQLTMDADRVVTIRRPDGTHAARGEPPRVRSKIPPKAA
jgi:hypothetical protein